MSGSTQKARQISYQEGTGRTAWVWQGEVYIAQSPLTEQTVRGREGMPADVRWECSEAHWNHYWPTVHEPEGWCGEAELQAED